MGTLPSQIEKFVRALKHGKTAADWVDWAVGDAVDDLRNFVHEPILKALKASPDGVRTEKFQGVWHKGAFLPEPKDVAVAMAHSKAVVYHRPSWEYRLASRAHRTALLERWVPEEDRYSK